MEAVAEIDGDLHLHLSSLYPTWMKMKSSHHLTKFINAFCSTMPFQRPTPPQSGRLSESVPFFFHQAVFVDKARPTLRLFARSRGHCHLLFYSGISRYPAILSFAVF